MSLRFTYWDCWGRGQAQRDMLYDSRAVPFDDDRLPLSKIYADGKFTPLMTADQWPALKVSKAKTGPIGTVPFVSHGGVALNQTVATSEYIAELCGFMPSTAQDRARASMVSETCHIDVIIPLCLATNGSETPQRSAFKALRPVPGCSEPLLGYLAFTVRRLEQLLEANQGGSAYFVGSEICHADFWAFECVEAIRQVCSTGTDGNDEGAELESLILGPVPKLIAHHDRIAERPNFKCYLQSEDRPKVGGYLFLLSDFGENH